MDPGSSTPKVAPRTEDEDILNCWKDISRYLQRDVRTVMRWERSRGLPVHRLPGGPKSAVYASKRELEAWRAAGSIAIAGERGSGESCAETVLEPTDASIPGAIAHGRRRLLFSIGTVLILGALGLAAWLVWKTQHVSPLSIRSLAVLPFKNLSGDPAQDYFSAGIYESLITDLARASKLRVISRTSAAQYRKVEIPVKQIARELGVDALVEGSVLRIGDRVRITAQLIRCDNDEHVWAATYDRDVGDVLGLMGEVSQAITNEINVSVQDRRQPRPPSMSQKIRPEVLDLYLRAEHSLHLLTREGFESALPQYRRVIELDPGFPLAWRGLAWTRVAQVWFGYLPGAEALPEAREAAREALRLDDGLGEAFGVLGFISLYWDWDFETARKHLARAVDLSPNSTMVRHQYADYLLVKGQVEQSLEQVRVGHQSDPLSWPGRGVLLYHILMARHYEEVASEGRRMIASGATVIGIHDYVARALWLLGRHEEALSEWKLAPSAGDSSSNIDRVYRQEGARAFLLSKAEAAAASARAGSQDAFDVASWFACANDRDRAFEWLELSFKRREPRLLHLVADPFLDPIRSEPRFTALSGRIGIQQNNP